jgi:hypothetical protein
VVTLADMSTSTDALLGWGVAFDEEIHDEDDVLWDLRHDLTALGVVVEMHQSSDYSKPCIFIAESFRRAWRGQIVEVDPREPGSDWGEKIAAALRLLQERTSGKVTNDDEESYAWTTEQAPGWKLVSWWS